MHDLALPVAALIGNPNSGKTTLMNALTGQHQRVGNWSGVTVALKRGRLKGDGAPVELVDLPGVYSLESLDEEAADQQVAKEFIQAQHADVIVNVLDASHLERHLYLTTQLLESPVPLIVVLNMMDLAEKGQKTIDLVALREQLGCPVIPVTAHKNKGIKELIQAVSEASVSRNVTHSSIPRPPEFEAAQQEDPDIALADLRYTFAHRLAKLANLQPSESAQRWTARVDKLVLHRFWGLPIFLLIMYLLFFLAFSVSGIFQNALDQLTELIFVQGLGSLLAHWHLPAWFIALASDGVGRGLNTVLTFIPVLTAMFFFIAWLEQSGYMARASFVMDRLFKMLGLPGQAFVPLIIGFGCNVPAVLATRTLSNPRERILTALMAPFMSCSARLAIYSVFVATFFPKNGHNVIFVLYLAGLLAAIGTVALLRRGFVNTDVSPLVMEMPDYHPPAFSVLWRTVWHRLKRFLLRAGKVIVSVAVLLSVLRYVVYHGTPLLNWIGQGMTPLFAPMGIRAENWPAVVALMTGVLAKEVVIGTLNTLYSQGHHLSGMIGWVDIVQGLKLAGASILFHIKTLPSTLLHPLQTVTAEVNMSSSSSQTMLAQFGSGSAAFAYLLFVSLYMPCVSTLSVLAREINRRWALFATLWSFLLAYGAAVAFWQCASLQVQPVSLLVWGALLVSLGILSGYFFKRSGIVSW